MRFFNTASDLVTQGVTYIGNMYSSADTNPVRGFAFFAVALIAFALLKWPLGSFLVLFWLIASFGFFGLKFAMSDQITVSNSEEKTRV
jgi:hypothetical protein